MLNATEAIDETGTVDCTTALVESEESQAASIRITIADTGAGLPAEHAGEVFRVGFTTKQAGSGIGLSVAKRAIELHGGTIGFETVEKRGSTVTITLPCRIDTAKLRRPIPIRSSLIEDPAQLIAVE